MRDSMLVITCLMLAGCSQAPSYKPSPIIEDDRFAAFDKRIKKLEGDAIATEVFGHKTATIQPTESGFSFLATDMGNFAVSVKNVRPYANGSQIDLQIGNPTAARIDDFGATIEWGRAGPDGFPMEDNHQTMTFNPGGSIPAGSWRDFSINLGAIPPASLGWVRLSDPKTGGISLRRDTGSME